MPDENRFRRRLRAMKSRTIQWLGMPERPPTPGDPSQYAELRQALEFVDPAVRAEIENMLLDGQYKKAENRLIEYAWAEEAGYQKRLARKQRTKKARVENRGMMRWMCTLVGVVVTVCWIYVMGWVIVG